MCVYRILHILKGDTVNRFREFLSMWWERAGLKAILAPVVVADGSAVAVRVIEDPHGLSAVNPFIPLMQSNSASLVSEFINDHPYGRLAVLLRPCELWTLVELQKRNRVFQHRLSSPNASEESRVVLVGVDCPGTYQPAEFARISRLYGVDTITREALNMGSTGNSIHPLLRTACQSCCWPAPAGADITIGSIGVASEGYLLVMARDEETDARLNLHETADGLAIKAQIAPREQALNAISQERSRNWEQRNAARPNQLGNLGGVLASLTRCTLCADCLDACPLYHGELSGMLGVGGDRQPKRPLLSELVDVTRWLASCSGCGMCEEACSSGVSLTALVLSLSHIIREELHYRAGNPDQPLPWGSSGSSFELSRSKTGEKF